MNWGGLFFPIIKTHLNGVWRELIAIPRLPYCYNLKCAKIALNKCIVPRRSNPKNNIGGKLLFVTLPVILCNEDFLGVISQVEAIIYQQKFTGAAADLLNTNIISRDLGIKIHPVRLK